MDNIAISNLAFTQNNLQDYIDCRRRFQLKHIKKLAWPAIAADPVMGNERMIQLGSRFHKMIQQYYSGIPAEVISSQVHDPDLERWWENFNEKFLLASPTSSLEAGARFYPEVLLTGYFDNLLCRAKYDLIAIDSNGMITIYDWKSSRKKTARSVLSERIQTRLYPCLLVKAGGYLRSGVEINPEDVRMVYWFAEFPDQPEEFLYDSEKFNQDVDYISDALAKIMTMQDDEFEMTTKIERCKFCVYRSYCQRGVEAGPLIESDQDIDAALDNLSDFTFEQIDELPF